MTSGRAMAITTPGRPAPDPDVHDLRVGGTSEAIAAQFSMWRTRAAGTSRGPISPLLTPESARWDGEGPRQVHAIAEEVPHHRRRGLVGNRVDGSIALSGTSRSARGQHDDATAGLHTLGLAASPASAPRRARPCARSVHRLQPDRVPVRRTSPPPRGGDVLECRGAGRPGNPPRRASAGCARRSSPGRPAAPAPAVPRAPRPAADQAAQLTVATALGDDRHRRPPVLDVDVDVAVEVGDVEELLEVVRRDLALLLEAAQRRTATPTRRRPLLAVLLARRRPRVGSRRPRRLRSSSGSPAHPSAGRAVVDSTPSPCRRPARRPGGRGSVSVTMLLSRMAWRRPPTEAPVLVTPRRHRFLPPGLPPARRPGRAASTRTAPGRAWHLAGCASAASAAGAAR